MSSQGCNDLNHQGTEAGLNVSLVPDSDDLSITVDGEEWFRSSIKTLNENSYLVTVLNCNSAQEH